MLLIPNNGIFTDWFKGVCENEILQDKVNKIK